MKALNLELVRSLGADEVVDYRKQEFENVPRDYEAVLGTVKGDALMKSLRILKPNSTIVSLIGPPYAAFARARGMNLVLKVVFGLLSGKIIRAGRNNGTTYSFLFVHPSGRQLAEIGEYAGRRP
jgi:NADPH:quinone reductase-like Zn-dependent oxidoreductase